MRICKLAISVAGIAFALGSCIDASSKAADDASRSAIVVSGALADGFGGPSSGSRSISRAVSAIASFKVLRDGLKARATVPVRADGGFEVDFGEADGSDGILLYVDERAPDIQSRYDRTGFITLASSDGATMARLPLSRATRDSIDIGTVSYEAAAGRGVSSLDRVAQERLFGADFDLWQFWYRYDNALREARNAYVNKGAGIGQFCRAHSSQRAHRTLDSIRNVFSPGDDFPNRIYGIGFDVMSPVGHGYEDIRGKTAIMELVPPVDIQANASQSVYGPDYPLSSSTSPDLGGAFTIGSNPVGTGSYSIGLDILGGIPGGTWRIRVDGSLYAIFDFTSLSPYDAQGHFLYFIPSVKASVSDAGLLERLELEWWSWGESAGAYAKVANQALVGEWIDEFGFGIGHAEIEEIAHKSTTIASFANRWTFDPADSSSIPIESIWVLYQIGDMSFSFGFSAP